MRQINCIIPLRICISGSPENLNEDELSSSITQAVNARLRFSYQQLVATYGNGVPPASIHMPEVEFPASIFPETKANLQALIYNAIGAAITGHASFHPRTQFILTDYPSPAGPRPAPVSSRTSTRKRGRVVLAAGQDKVFWDSIRSTVLSQQMLQDPSRRTEFVKVLVSLIDYEQAHQILRAALDIPVTHTGVRLAVLNGLYEVAGDEEFIWELILYGAGQENDYVAEGKFFDWFKRLKGAPTVEFLKKKLAAADESLRHKAARVVLYLLDRQADQGSAGLTPNFSKLKRMAAQFNLWTGGALGAESMKNLVKGEISTLVELAEDLAITVHAGPVEDSLVERDVEDLRGFQSALKTRLAQVDGLNVADLEDLDIRLAQAIQAATQIRTRTHVIWENARLLQTYLGNAAKESDEIATLFKVRHDYVAALVQSLAVEDFVEAIHEIDMRYVDFAGAVALVKWPHVSERLKKTGHLLLQAKEIQLTAGPIDDAFFIDFRMALDQEHKRLLNQPWNSTNYHRAVQAETDVNIFGIYVSMFAQYATALRMQNDLISFDVGSSGFRAEQGTKLQDIRQQIGGYAKGNKLKEFSDKSETIQKTLQEIAEAIQYRVKVDIAIHLLITAIAAILSFGAAAVARIALLGETLALVRTAEAVGTITFLVEAGTFTAAQLTGESLAFGKQVTLGSAAEAFASNVAFFGVFRVVGKFTAPLGRSSALLRFIAIHGINLSVMTGISAIMTRVQTGKWPQDITLFLASSLANYAIIAAIGAAAQKISKPFIEARVRSMVQTLDQQNNALFQRYQMAVDARVLTEPEFESMRKEKLALHKSARELAQFLHDNALITDEHFDAIRKSLQAMDEVANSARFQTPEPLLVSKSGGRMVRELPSPTQVQGLVRLGESEVYRFDPTHSSGELPSLLARYEANGFTVRRYQAGIVRVIRPDGNTQFVLEPGPTVPALKALPPPPARTPDTPLRDVTFLENVIGLVSAAERSSVNADLIRINPKLIETLQHEFEEPVALAALGLFVEQRGNLKSRWTIDSVRGLASILQPERGIIRATVRRLFVGRTSEDLSAFFQQYWAIKDMPGANFLVDAELNPSRSIKLVGVYDALRRARIQMPDGTSRKAIRGLLHWVEEAGAASEVVKKLSAIPLDRRLVRLEADSPIKDPALRPSSRAEDILRRHALDVRPGINFLTGTSSELVNAAEKFGLQHGGSFVDSAIRAKFQEEVESYRKLVASFQAGELVERNLEGQRNELDAVVAALEISAQVFSLGRRTEKTVVRVSLAHLKLANGLKLINFPPEVEIQIDVGARLVNGRLRILETTTGDLSLPDSMQGLDPANGGQSGSIDFATLQPKRNANERKFIQMLKLRAAADFATELARNMGNANVELPELVISVGSITAPARRAAEFLGFKVQLVKAD